jgi:fatty-acyl-CoA synthase
MIESTMQDFPLTITAVLGHGQRVYAGAECVTWTDDGPRRGTFGEIGANANRLAGALTRLGVREGDRVGTFMWNSQEHMEAYLAVPAMGAVLHTLNIRLYPEQLAYVINHAEDKVVIIDDSLVPVLAKVLTELETVEQFVVVGDGDASALGTDIPVLRYHELLAAESPEFAWPEIDERAAAAMCYTSGTTGNPKGVAYSHRSAFLHSFGPSGMLSIRPRHQRGWIPPPTLRGSTRITALLGFCWGETTPRRV